MPLLCAANLLAHNNIGQIVTAVKFHYKVLQFSDSPAPLEVPLRVATAA